MIHWNSPALLQRLQARWWLWRNSADALKRRVAVERYLVEASVGKKPLPDEQKCKELAAKLALPEWRWR